MSGIWIESKTFNQDMLEKYEIPLSITTLVLFIPFSGIEYIISSVECVSLSETALAYTPCHAVVLGPTFS